MILEPNDTSLESLAGYTVLMTLIDGRKLVQIDDVFELMELIP
jgi:hypothetical protein